MKQRVLVIEDDPGVARMIRQMLEQAGYEVLSAPDGRAGMALLAQERVDLVVTDIVMPEVEGIELIRHVKATYPGLPVVAISGGGRSHNADFLRFARGMGADATLPKPFRRDDLIAAIAGALPPKAAT